ncbi:MAG: hypothetical protein ACLUZ0_00015 [Coprococcus sp.]
MQTVETMIKCIVIASETMLQQQWRSISAAAKMLCGSHEPESR